MPNRYICDVLAEMRKSFKTFNFGHIRGLIEEAQTLANRMEAALNERKDYHRWHEMAKKEKKEFNKLRKKTDKERKKKGEDTKGQQNWPDNN